MINYIFIDDGVTTEIRVNKESVFFVTNGCFIERIAKLARKCDTF